MTRVLVTGARSPAALELCRRLAAEGVEVYAADTLRFALARFSRAVKAYVRLPSPRYQLDAFAAELARVIDQEQIDLVIPTCEEAFHIAAIKDRLPARARYFVDDLAQLDRLHNKLTVQEMLVPGGLILGPETEAATSETDVRWIDASQMINDRKVDGVVFKRAYSRFAEGSFVKPSPDQLDAITATVESPFAAQAFVAGTEMCVYATAIEGQVTAISVYQPLYRAGLGAGIYFQPVDAADIERGIIEFIAHHALNGQMSFDVIRSQENGRVYMIECNPRATSGVHLLDEAASFSEIFGLVPIRTGHYGVRSKAKMVGLATVTYGLRHLKGLRAYLNDLRRASDVIGAKGDLLPIVGQLLAIVELFGLAYKHRVSTLAATTYDIEWNGPNA
jgi:hypothetical protein